MKFQYSFIQVTSKISLLFALQNQFITIKSIWSTKNDQLLFVLQIKMHILKNYSYKIGRKLKYWRCLSWKIRMPLELELQFALLSLTSSGYLRSSFLLEDSFQDNLGRLDWFTWRFKFLCSFMAAYFTIQP